MHWKSCREGAQQCCAPTVKLVAGYGFGGFFFLGGVAIAITVAMTVAAGVAVAGGWGDAYWLAGVGEVGRDGFGYVAYRADLDYRGLSLLQD